MQKYGLQRIILIDSFIPHISTYIDVDKHACMNGTNGGGKTTSLKLIPFFYGAEPSQLNPKVENKENFLDFYLPRTTSLIIFEYLREGGLNCAVAYRHSSGTKPAYRFLNHGYTTEAFSVAQSNLKNKFCSSDQLAMHWNSLDLDFSHQLDIVLDYRGIIQNDKRLLNRSGVDRKTSALGWKYGLGSPKTHMRHIEKIALAILGREGQMEKIKDMLADILTEDNLIIPIPPSGKRNQKLKEHVDWMRDFNDKLPFMKKVQNDFTEYQVLQSQLNVCANTLKSYHISYIEQEETSKKAFSELHQTMKDQESEWSNTLSNLQENIAYYSGEIKNINESIDQLMNESERYESDDLEAQCLKFEQKDNYKWDMEKAVNRYQRLLDNVEEEKVVYNNRKQEEKISYIERQNNVNREIQIVSEDIAQLNERFSDKKQNIESRKHQEIMNYKDSIIPERENLVAQQSEAKALSKNSGRTDDEVLSIKEAEDRIEQSEKLLKSQDKDVSLAEQNYKTLKSQYEYDLSDYNYSNKELEDEKVHLKSLQKSLYPEDGSFLAQLRLSDESWTRNIAKVIDPELLDRKDLSPIFHATTDSFYGWQIDTAAIPSKEFAEEEAQLQSKFSAQEQYCAQLENKLKEKDKELTKTKEQLKNIENEISSLKVKRRQLDNSVNTGKEHLSTLQSEVDRAVSDRKLQFKKDFDVYTSKLKKLTDQEKDTIEKLNEDFKSEYQAASSDFILDNSRLGDKKNVLVEQNDKLTNEYQLTLKQIDSDFKSICLNKGVSEKQLDDAHRNKLLSEEIYQNIINSENLVHEYKRWLRVDWPNKSAFEDSLSKSQHTKSKLEKEKQKAKREYESEIEKFNKSKNTIEGFLTESRTALENIKLMQDRLGVFPDNNEEIDELPLNRVLINADDGLDKKQKLNSDLRSNMNNIESFISRHSDMQIAQGWERDCQELAEKLNKDIYDSYLYLSKQELLERFITKTIPQAQETLIEQVYSISQELNEFSSGLLEAERHITSQSNLISQSIDRNQTIHALSDIKIVMESKIKDQEYWEYLHKFQKAWRLLNEKGRGVLPDNKFIETLRDTLHVLQQVKIEQNLKSLFDLYILVRDKGKLATIRTDQQLKDASSNGLSYLLLCIIFTGIGRLLCKDTDVNLHWPVDELGIIHGENISLLFKMLDQGGVVMLAGFPSNDPDMLRNFTHRHLIDFKKGISTVEIEQDSLLELIKNKKNEKQQFLEAST